MSYCSYDYTNDDGDSSFMGCYPDIENANGVETQIIESEEKPVKVFALQKKQSFEPDQKNGTDFRIIDVTKKIPVVESNDTEDDTERTDDASTLVSTTEKRRAICTRRPFIVVSLLLGAFLAIMILATLFREQRKEPISRIIGSSETQLYGSGTLRLDDNTDPPKREAGEEGESQNDHVTSFGIYLLGALGENEICKGNDDCESGLCRGASPPYRCQARQESCHLCSENRNCLSGLCVRRSGKSVCASTSDGTMDIGCFCDVNEDCTSQRCEGGERMYTCRQPLEVTIEEEQSTNENNDALEESCSSHMDCMSHICVGFAPEKDGKCSDGREGSICGADEDCVTERCSQGICEAKQGTGGTCKGHTDCVSGLCIGFSNFNYGLCLDTSSDNTCNDEGESCGHSMTGTCSGGFCRDFQLREGEACLEDGDCLSGTCAGYLVHFEKVCSK